MEIKRSILCVGIIVWCMMMAGCGQKETEGNLNIDIEADREEAKKGDVIVFTVQIENSGTKQINEITLSCGPKEYHSYLANLCPDESLLFTKGETDALLYVVTDEDEKRGYCEMYASAKGQDYEGKTVKADDLMQVKVI